MNRKNLVEVLLFASPEPLTQSHLDHVIQDEDTVKLSPLVDELNAEYKKSGKGLKIMQIAGGFQILSDTKYHVYLDRLFHKKRKMQLSRPAMEALSIIAEGKLSPNSTSYYSLKEEKLKMRLFKNNLISGFLVLVIFLLLVFK